MALGVGGLIVREELFMPHLDRWASAAGGIRIGSIILFDNHGFGTPSGMH